MSSSPTYGVAENVGSKLAFVNQNFRFNGRLDFSPKSTCEDPAKHFHDLPNRLPPFTSGMPGLGNAFNLER